MPHLPVLESLQAATSLHQPHLPDQTQAGRPRVLVCFLHVPRDCLCLWRCMLLNSPSFTEDRLWTCFFRWSTRPFSVPVSVYACLTALAVGISQHRSYSSYSFSYTYQISTLIFCCDCRHLHDSGMSWCTEQLSYLGD